MKYLILLFSFTVYSQNKSAFEFESSEYHLSKIYDYVDLRKYCKSVTPKMVFIFQNHQKINDCIKLYQSKNKWSQDVSNPRLVLPTNFKDILKDDAPDFLKKLSWHYDDSVEFNVTTYYADVNFMEKDFKSFLNLVEVSEFVENPRSYSRVVGTSPRTDFAWHIHYSSSEFKSLDKETMELYNFYKSMIAEIFLKREMARDDLSDLEKKQAVHWNPDIYKKGVIRLVSADRIEIRVHHLSLLKEIEEIDYYFKRSDKKTTIKLLVEDIEQLFDSSTEMFNRSERFLKKFSRNKHLKEILENSSEMKSKYEKVIKKNSLIEDCYKFLEL